MSTRSIPTLCLLLTLSIGFAAACGDSVPSDVGAEADAAASGAVLAVVGSDSIVVAPRGATDIRIAYRDADDQPVAAVSVEFVLEGDAPAVSLSVEEAKTDLDGIATARLTAGSDSASFRVRANANGVDPVYVDVKVLKSAVLTTQIQARYTGVRNVVTRTITAFAGMGCEAALETGTEGDLTGSYDDPKGSAEFELGPGLHYAFIGWGRDHTGALLAEGCSELDVPVDPKAKLAPLVIELVDRALSLAGSYKVTLGFDVAVSAKRAGDTVIAAGQTLLPTDSPRGANYLLDAIDSALRGAGKGDDATMLAAARIDEDFAASLKTTLDDSKVGPEVWLTKLAAQLETRGSALFLDGSYGVTSLAGVPMSLTLESMESRTVEGSLSILDYGTMSLPAATIDAQYDDARAVIAVETLGLQLGLGSYALRLLDAIDGVEPDGLAGLLAGQSGCAELVTWAAAQSVIASACDGSCVQTACGTAIDALLSEARTQLAALDLDHPSIGVRGELLVFDRDEDGIVDEIGEASFEGSWGQAAGADEADAVDADFTVTSTLSKL